MSGFIEAYVCECGHAMRKHLDGPLMGCDRFSFHNCCPKCGAPKDKIKLKSGKWEKEATTTGWWIFKTTTYTDANFVESGKYL